MITQEQLVEYFAKQARRREERVAAALATLTPREALLVREAAVMGYVIGAREARDGQYPVPPDSAIVRDVVLGCISQNDSNPDHFKLIAAADEGRRPRVQKERKSF
jgi:hypothetical protein